MAASALPGTTATESGTCLVNWTSQDPRPPGNCAPNCTVTQANQVIAHPAGRSSILGMAIGEESFVDANGNGIYDAGETFYDRAERFRDDSDFTMDNFDTDATGTNMGYVVGDFFYDFNNDQTRDSADGVFEGVLCSAGLPVCDPTKTTTGIGKRTLIIFSTSDAAIFGPASVVIPKSTTGQLVYRIEDMHGNPVPYDATITATTSGMAGSISPSSFTEGCSIQRGGELYAFQLTAGATAGGGSVQISVTTKAGVMTTALTSVTVQ